MSVTSALKRTLSFDGYRVFTAGNATEAFELLARHQIGVVVSDQCMPEMNGSEFLERVKELYPDTVRIMLTGFADLDSATDAINRGAIYKYFTKPWNDDLIRDGINQAFKHYKLLNGRGRNFSKDSADLKLSTIPDDVASIFAYPL